MKDKLFIWYMFRYNMSLKSIKKRNHDFQKLIFFHIDLASMQW